MADIQIVESIGNNGRREWAWDPRRDQCPWDSEPSVQGSLEIQNQWSLGASARAMSLAFLVVASFDNQEPQRNRAKPKTVIGTAWKYRGHVRSARSPSVLVCMSPHIFGFRIDLFEIDQIDE